MDNQEALKELIVAHINRPRNRRQIASPTCDCVGKNPLCGDEVTLQIEIDSTSGHIKDIAFTGRGCPISQASASIVTETCQGMTTAKAKHLASHLRAHITGAADNTQLPDELVTSWENVAPLVAIQLNPARIKCVTLAWHTLCHALSNVGATETID